MDEKVLERKLKTGKINYDVSNLITVEWQNIVFKKDVNLIDKLIQEKNIFVKYQYKCLAN